MNNDMLLEIGVEEIPAGYLPFAIEQLSTIAGAELKSARLPYKNIHIWATPRRLILYVEDVAGQQISTETEISGPPEKSAFMNGKPTAAAIGFAKKYGIDVSELTVKNGKVQILKKEPSLKTETVLPEIFKKIISTLTFPKTMVWETSRFRFVRPIKWLLALYGKKTIKFQIADVKSSNYTCVRYGKKIKISDPKKFADVLRNKSVIVNQTARLDALRKTVASSIKNIKDGEISASDEFFETVNNLVEFPTAILCEFAQKFLNLPEEIIQNTLKKQKNFVIVNGKTKKNLTYFVAVKDGISTNLDIIREGYEKVIAARLEDAEFYFKNDTKTKLEEKTDRLKGIVFQEKLGTIHDKVQRMQKLSNWLNSDIATQRHSDIATVERICFLCKADLSTEMVGEFSELQGVYGKICALKDGENKTVADGIEQHWWPINYEGKIPDSIEASVVSIADKIDTLAGDFALGLVPTGSADPYGLRRAAFGIIKIAIEKKVSFSLKELMIQAFANLPFKLDDRAKIISQLEDFIKQRLDTYLKEKNVLQDEIDSVLSVRLVNILDAFNRAVAVHSIRKLPDFEPLAVSFKRIGNILKQAGIRDEGRGTRDVDENLLKEQEEKELYQKFLETKNKIEQLFKNGDYAAFLNELVLLRKPVDNFFDKVLIMVQNEEIKTNRLALLSVIYNQFIKIADFSKIVVKSSP
ncbi:MAG: glycine--tRNA ligase subunit beta [Elusimicrobia bacterium HGW-Elusimicrobia-4]|nr:MAG: glycine--tRNA ligase subunit beta [Elusimicrobia bacterium HGW-Elusimicrobia-4]